MATSRLPLFVCQNPLHTVPNSPEPRWPVILYSKKVLYILSTCYCEMALTGFACDLFPDTFLCVVDGRAVLYLKQASSSDLSPQRNSSCEPGDCQDPADSELYIQLRNTEDNEVTHIPEVSIDIVIKYGLTALLLFTDRYKKGKRWCCIALSIYTYNDV